MNCQGVGAFVGIHTEDEIPGDLEYTGDILVVSEFTVGGSKPLLSIYKWIKTAKASDGHLQLIATIDPNSSTQFGNAAVNLEPETVPTYTDQDNETWSYTTSGGVSGTYPPFDFFEGTLNLTALNIPACFATFLTATKNSLADNSSLQDFATDTFEANPPPPSLTITEATLCGEAAGPSLTVCNPTAGVYTLSQPGEDDKVFTYPDDGNEVTFENLVIGIGFSIVVNINGCISQPATCGDYTSCSENTTASSRSVFQTPNQSIEPRSPSKVLATPNHFTVKIKFTLKSDLTGQGTLELYNLMGQKIATVYQGNIEPGSVITLFF